VYVTHDLAVVSSLAIRVAVMYAGRLAEVGRADQVLQRPAHPYVRGLLQAVPDIEGRRELTGIPGQAPDPGRPLEQCLFAPRCPLAVDECRQAIPPPVAVGEGHRAWCIRVAEPAGADVAAGPGVPSREVAGDDGGALLAIDDLDAGYGSRPVLHGISLSIPTGASLALVGESGSGKTTLARSIAGLHTGYTGTISLAGAQLARLRGRAPPPPARRSSTCSRTPTRRSTAALDRGVDRPAAALHRGASRPRRDRPPRRPRAGQRVAERGRPPPLPARAVRRPAPAVPIARALIVEPRLLVCDEVTSALDVSVQAVVIELLDELRRRRGLSMLFVTHNLALVHSVADEIAVIQEGRIVERGPVDRVLARPTSETTRTLIANVPGWRPSRPAPDERRRARHRRRPDRGAGRPGGGGRPHRRPQQDAGLADGGSARLVPAAAAGRRRGARPGTGRPDRDRDGGRRRLPSGAGRRAAAAAAAGAPGGAR
jgi:peptide/nickel transport system ATP-binding protein